MALVDWFAGRRRALQAAFGSLCVVLAGAVLSGGAAAQVTDEFEPFVYDPSRPTVLRLAGPIDLRTPVRLGNALDRYDRIDTLELASAGGSVYGALLMVDRIDAAGLKTVIPADEVCYSACSYLFLAGAERAAEGHLGVHQLAGADLANGLVALNDVLDMFARFEVPDEVRRRMLDTPADRMYNIGPADLARLGLLGRTARAAPQSPAADTRTPQAAPEEHASLAPERPVSPELEALREDAKAWFYKGFKPDPNISGIYSGSILCGDRPLMVVVHLVDRIGSGATASVTGGMGGTATIMYGDSRQQTAQGVFELVYSLTGNRVRGTPTRWIRQPQGHAMFGFSARLNAEDKLEGEIAQSDCSAFSL